MSKTIHRGFVNLSQKDSRENYRRGSRVKIGYNPEKPAGKALFSKPQIAGKVIDGFRIGKLLKISLRRTAKSNAKRQYLYEVTPV